MVGVSVLLQALLLANHLATPSLALFTGTSARDLEAPPLGAEGVQVGVDGITVVAHASPKQHTTGQPLGVMLSDSGVVQDSGRTWSFMRREAPAMPKQKQKQNQQKQLSVPSPTPAAEAAAEAEAEAAAAAVVASASGNASNASPVFYGNASGYNQHAPYPSSHAYSASPVDYGNPSGYNQHAPYPSSHAYSASPVNYGNASGYNQHAPFASSHVDPVYYNGSWYNPQTAPNQQPGGPYTDPNAQYAPGPAYASSSYNTHTHPQYLYIPVPVPVPVPIPVRVPVPVPVFPDGSRVPSVPVPQASPQTSARLTAVPLPTPLPDLLNPNMTSEDEQTVEVAAQAGMEEADREALAPTRDVDEEDGVVEEEVKDVGKVWIVSGVCLLAFIALAGVGFVVSGQSFKKPADPSAPALLTDDPPGGAEGGEDGTGGEGGEEDGTGDGADPAVPEEPAAAADDVRGGL